MHIIQLPDVPLGLLLELDDQLLDLVFVVVHLFLHADLLRTDLLELALVLLHHLSLLLHLLLQLLPVPLVLHHQHLPVLLQLLYLLPLHPRMILQRLITTVILLGLFFIFLVFLYGDLKCFALLSEQSEQRFKLDHIIRLIFRRLFQFLFHLVVSLLQFLTHLRFLRHSLLRLLHTHYISKKLCTFSLRLISWIISLLACSFFLY